MRRGDQGKMDQRKILFR